MFSFVSRPNPTSPSTGTAPSIVPALMSNTLVETTGAQRQAATETPAMIRQLENMGFTTALGREALEFCGYNMEAAIDYCLSNQSNSRSPSISNNIPDGVIRDDESDADPQESVSPTMHTESESTCRPYRLKDVIVNVDEMLQRMIREGNLTNELVYTSTPSPLDTVYGRMSRLRPTTKQIVIVWSSRHNVPVEAIDELYRRIEMIPSLASASPQTLTPDASSNQELLLTGPTIDDQALTAAYSASQRHASPRAMSRGSPGNVDALAALNRESIRRDSFQALSVGNITSRLEGIGLRESESWTPPSPLPEVHTALSAESDDTISIHQIQSVDETQILDSHSNDSINLTTRLPRPREPSHTLINTSSTGTHFAPVRVESRAATSPRQPSPLAGQLPLHNGVSGEPFANAASASRIQVRTSGENDQSQSTLRLVSPTLMRTSDDQQPSPNSGGRRPSPIVGDRNPSPTTGARRPSPTAGDRQPLVIAGTSDRRPSQITSNRRPSPNAGDRRHSPTLEGNLTSPPRSPSRPLSGATAAAAPPRPEAVSRIQTASSPTPILALSADDIIVAPTISPMLSPSSQTLRRSHQVSTTQGFRLHRRTKLRQYIYEVNNEVTGRPEFKVFISLQQPYCHPNHGPQGNRTSRIYLGALSNRRRAERMGESMSPPQWVSRAHATLCVVCEVKVNSGFLQKGHHCRNCGYLVCGNCSTKWPSAMVPDTFHNGEKSVRVCDTCHALTESFASALRTGKVYEAKAIFATGNVNVHTPFCIFSRIVFPIHCAVESGSIPMLKWLLEELMVPLLDSDRKSLRTSDGNTVLAIAARNGNLPMMEYLIRECNCAITDILDVNHLQRALHVFLRAPGPLPPLPPGSGPDPLAAALETEEAPSAIATPLDDYDHSVVAEASASVSVGSNRSQSTYERGTTNIFRTRFHPNAVSTAAAAIEMELSQILTLQSTETGSAALENGAGSHDVLEAYAIVGN